MEDDRQKKIKIGKEKLEAYKKRKSPRSKSNKSSNENSASSDNSQSDFSFSISITPPSLPDNNESNIIVPSPSPLIAAIGKQQSDDTDSIIENIEPDSLSNSENDRSLHEIEITNIPGDENNSICTADDLVDAAASKDVQNENNSVSIKIPDSTNDRVIGESVEFKNVLDITDSKELTLIDKSDLLSSPVTLNKLSKPIDMSVQSDISESVSNCTDNLELNAPNVSLVDNISEHSGINLINKAGNADETSIDLLLSETEVKENTLTNFNIDDLPVVQGKLLSLETRSPQNSLSPRQSGIFFKESNSKNDEIENFNISDRSLNRIRDLEEQLANKDAALTALNAELDSLKEASSNMSTYSLGTVTTEYKELAEEYKSKLFEFQKGIEHRDNLIEKLTVSLKEALSERQQLKQQSEQFGNEIEKLKSQLTETTAIVNAHKWKLNIDCVKENNSKSLIEIAETYTLELNRSKSLENLNTITKSNNLEKPNIEKLTDISLIFNKLYEVLSPEQISVFDEFKISVEYFLWQQLIDIKTLHASKIKQLVEKFDNEKSEHVTEVSRLRELLSSIKCGSTEIMELREELEAKHNRDMEKLRKFFEKKCAEMEKNYSDEVYSQHSRKHSESSSCSELGSDLLFSGPPALLPISNIDNKSPLTVNKELALSPVKQHQNYESVKAQLENRHRLELDDIRNDFENKVQDIMVNNDTVLQALENEYVEQIESLKSELESMKVERSLVVGEAGSTSEEELAVVVLSYERRLQEQVELARRDMCTALEIQVQNLIANNGEDDQCPNELKQLRDIYVQKYEEKMEDLKRQHAGEIAKMKDHETFIIRSVERQKRRSQEYESQFSIDADQQLVIEERDSLKRMTHTLRHIITELFKYVSICEDELNNTLVDELIKYGFSSDISKTQTDLNESSTTIDSDDVNSSQIAKVKRVHFAPDVSGIINIFDDESFHNTFSNNKDLSIEFKSELNTCLERLKAEASAILAMSVAVKQNMQAKEIVNTVSEKHDENSISHLSKQLMSETLLKNELALQLKEHKNLIHSLESERLCLEQQLSDVLNKQKDLENELDATKQKIVQLISENGQKEIVSEGYGEIGTSPVAPIVSPRETLAQVLERTRLILEESGEGVDRAELLSLIETLFTASHRTQEDAKKDAHDLQLQVEAADKKLRATMRFLEEQTSEREIERDEAQRQLQELRNQLAQRDRDLNNVQLMAAEVENFEQKMQEMEALIVASDLEKQRLEMEYKDAVDKIVELREIIQTLESQIELRTDAEVEFKTEIDKLLNTVRQQGKMNVELAIELDTYKNGPDANQLMEHVQHLENELSLWKAFGTVESLQQITVLLGEIGINLTKQTRDLETLHATVSSVSCSSPSEDVSVGDKATKQLPLDNNESTELLESTRRISAALQKHIRVEGAAVKRIKDLEMQLAKTKHLCEDYQIQRDALQERITEQMTEISSLEMRLEEQRRLVQTATKQTNMCLEAKIYDLENEIRSLKDTLLSRDKQIKKLDTVLNKTKKQLSESERELNSTSDNEKEIVTKLKSQIEELVSEKKSLQSKLDREVSNSKSFPELMDSILADKNADIERLSKVVEEKEKQIEIYTSLNISAENLRMMSESYKEQTEGKSSARTLSDVVSISEFDEGDFRMRKAENSAHSMQSLDLIYLKRSGNATAEGSPVKDNFNQVFVKDIERVSYIPPDMSTINDLKLHEDLSEKSPKSISDKSSKSSEKKVHFDDGEIIDSLKKEITELKTEIANNLAKIDEYEDQLNILPELQNEIQQLKKNVERFNVEKIELNEQFEIIKMSEIALRANLDEVKLKLIEKDRELGIVKEDIVRRDDMFLNATKEKQDLRKKCTELETRIVALQDFEVLMPEKDIEIRVLEGHVQDLNETLNKYKKIETDIAEKQKEIEKLKCILEDTEKKYENKVTEVEKCKEEIKELERKIKEKDEVNEKLIKELENRSVKYDSLAIEVSDLKNKIEEKDNMVESLKNNSIESISLKEELKTSQEKIKQLVDKVADRECEIEIMNEDIDRYHEDIASLQNQIEKSPKNNPDVENSKHLKELREKDVLLKSNRLEISELRKEITHLQEYLKEKDKIINQMSADSKTLQTELEKVQSKIQETGNILDLTKKYRDEQCANLALRAEVKSLKAALVRVEGRSPTPCELSIQEITDKVRQELDYSAQLDSDLISAIVEEKSLSYLKRNPTPDFEDNKIEIITSEKSEVQNKSDCTLRKRLQKVQNFNIEVPPSMTSTESNSLSQLHSEIDSLKEQIKEKDCINSELNELKEKLMNEVQIVQEKFLQEKENCEKLKELLDAEKQHSNAIQIQDADIIENLRVRLEAALDTETELEKLLNNEKKVREDLSTQLKFLQERLEMDLNPELIIQENFKMELEKICTEKEQFKYENEDMRRKLKDSSRQIEAVKSENTVLRQQISDMRKIDRAELREKLDQVIEENVKLKIEVQELKNRISDLMTDFEKMSILMKSQTSIAKQKNRLDDGNSDELKQIRKELADRQREVENARVLLDDFGREKMELMAQFNALKSEYKAVKDCEIKLIENLANERDAQMKSPVPAKFLQKLQELKTLLADHVRENKQMSDTLVQLTEERKSLQTRVHQLEELQKTTFQSRITENEMEERANHLFGKYLRAESYRKSLAWQKQYLFAILHCYEMGKTPNLSPLVKPIGSSKEIPRKRKSFRYAAYAVIAMFRMQFLVRRWQTGKRIGGKAWSHQRHTIPIPVVPTFSGSGIPVNVPNRSAFRDSNASTPVTSVPNTNWYSASPPCKDTTNRRYDVTVPPYSNNPYGAGLPLGAPLRAPAVISQYMERFDQIQQRLGLALNPPP